MEGAGGDVPDEPTPDEDGEVAVGLGAVAHVAGAVPAPAVDGALALEVGRAADDSHAAAARHGLVGDDSVADEGRGGAHDADATAELAEAVADGEVPQDCGPTLALVEGDDRAAVAAGDGRVEELDPRGPDLDGLALEIDALVVGAGGDDHRVTVGGAVDGGLDRRLARGDVDHGGRRGRGERSRRQHRGQQAGRGQGRGNLSFLTPSSISAAAHCKTGPG